MAQLSIIVTSYNIEPYIEQCLDTIVNQTLTDIEIIVVDDGSSDESPAIIRRYADRDDRIVPVLLTENTIGGVATAANTGLDRATSPYVGFADGDDFYEPDMFEKLLNAAHRHDADLAMCDYRIHDNETGTDAAPADRSRWSAVDQECYDLTVETRKQFLRFIAVPWRKIYRRSMLEEHGLRFPVGDYFYEDNPFHWFNLLTAERIAVVPEVLCAHRVARAGQTMSTADANLFKIFEHHETIRRWLLERDLATEFGPTLLAWAISQLEWIGPRTPKELRKQLFETVSRVYAPYSKGVVGQALVEGNKGQRAHELSDALIHDNYAKFNAVLDSGTKSTSPVVRAAYHLRYSGVSHTARLAKRYAVNQVQSRNLPSYLGGGSHKISNDDLMFAMTVLQKQLDALSARVEALHEQLDDEG